MEWRPPQLTGGPEMGPVGGSVSSGSIVPGACKDLAPMTADMGSVGLAPKRLNLTARSLHSNAITTIKSVCAPSTRRL